MDESSPVVSEAERAIYEEPGFQAKLTNLDPMKGLPELRPSAVRSEQTSFNADTPLNIQKAIKEKMRHGAATIRYDTIDQ